MPVDNHFSTFFDGGSLTTNDIVVGLRNGINTRFTFTAQSNYAYLIGTPVIGDFVTFANTIGGIKDSGFSPSNNAKTKVVMANAVTTVNHIAVYSDIFGTVSQDIATAINSGNIQAGISGTAGYFASFPSNLLKGSLVFSASDNTGNTITTISNDPFGQASTILIPDPAQTTAKFIISDSAGTQLINTGNLTLSSGDITLTAGNIDITLGGVNVTSGNILITSGDLDITTGNVTVAAGNIQTQDGDLIAGNAAGSASNDFISYSPMAALGSLSYGASNSAGNFTVNVTNASFGQSSTITIPDPGAASASFLLSASSGIIHITSGSLQVDNGNIIAGSNGSAGYFQSYPAAVTSGTLKLAAVNSAGNFDVTISNASHGQASIVSIPDGAQATSSFVLTNSPTTQTIATGNLTLSVGDFTATSGNITATSGNITATDGNITAGSAAGATNYSFYSYTPTAALGFLTLYSTNNAGNFGVGITNESHGQTTVLTIPDGGSASSSFLLTNSAGTQTIATGSLALTTGNITLTTGNVQASDGDLIAGKTTGSTMNSFISYTPTTTLGSLRLKAANNAGNFDVTIANASHGQTTTLTVPNGGVAASNFIISNSTGTQTIATGGLTLTAGNIIASAGFIQASNSTVRAGQVGGCTENQFISFSTGVNLGQFRIQCIDNAGNFIVKIKNASHAQGTDYTIQDCGATTANFITSKSAGTQTISTGSLTLTSGTFTVTTGDIQAGDGNVIAGKTTGSTSNSVISYTPTTSVGSLALKAANNAGNYALIVTNASHGQASTYAIPDAGVASGTLLSCALSAANPQTNMFRKTFSGTITRAALAAGGTVALLTTAGTATYSILEIFIAAGTNFAGGGGNRNIEIYETTTGASYSIIPAATVQALSNQRWGTTAVPYPASISVMSTFGSGNSLSARYNGGTTDYSTTGDLSLGILFARVTA